MDRISKSISHFAHPQELPIAEQGVKRVNDAAQIRVQWRGKPVRLNDDEYFTYPGEPDFIYLGFSGNHADSAATVSLRNHRRCAQGGLSQRITHEQGREILARLLVYSV